MDIDTWCFFSVLFLWIEAMIMATFIKYIYLVLPFRFRSLVHFFYDGKRASMLAGMVWTNNWEFFILVIKARRKSDPGPDLSFWNLNALPLVTLLLQKGHTSNNSTPLEFICAVFIQTTAMLLSIVLYRLVQYIKSCQ